MPEDGKMKRPLAIIVAGGNGSGKTTLINELILPQVINFPDAPAFINADIWQQKTFGRTGIDEEAKIAQEWAEEERKKCIDSKVPFIAETVFSHESKVKLVKQLKDNGYNVQLYHVHLKDADLAINRIKSRVTLGGHSVPDDKVKARYERVIPHVAEATKYADRTFVLDNSHYGRAHQLVMVLEHGKISSLEREIPAWAEVGYKKQIEAFHSLNANEKKDLDSKILNLVSNAQIHHAAPGKFEGRIVFETTSLVAQRLGDTSKHFVIHEKNSLEKTPKINEVVSILHSNRSTRATVKSLDMSSTKEIKR